MYSYRLRAPSTVLLYLVWLLPGQLLLTDPYIGVIVALERPSLWQTLLAVLRRLPVYLEQVYLIPLPLICAYVGWLPVGFLQLELSEPPVQLVLLLFPCYLVVYTSSEPTIATLVLFSCSTLVLFDLI